MLFKRSGFSNQAGSISDPLWEASVLPYRFIAALPPADQRRLRAMAEDFIQQKEWHGAGGLELTNEIIVAIAAQACLPVLHLSLDLYDRFTGVVVYATGFLVEKTEVDDAGVVHEWTEEASGEAWPGGPVIISWEDASAQNGIAGYNVVVHEFAHKLDMADGLDDGIPVLDPRFHQGLLRREFSQVLDSAFTRFATEAEEFDGEELPSNIWGLDPYAAEHPVEFFAVSAEYLLTHGGETWPHPLTDWFRLLARYFRLPLPASVNG
jgi:Mlc titration factor MtfA (ptsG expression regulator)